MTRVLALPLAALLFLGLPAKSHAQVASATRVQQVAAPVLARPITRGERLGFSDFTTEDRAPAMARGALGPEAAAGMEALRNLPAGAVLRSSDVGPPQLVRRGEPVAVRYVSGGLVIGAGGRALANGAKGATVRVVLNATNRTLDGVVEGEGAVRVVAP